MLLRSINEMIVWTPGKDGLSEFDEVAQTGLNTVRIVWDSSGSADELDKVLKKALARRMIPMVEHHEATENLEKVSAVVDCWTRSDIVEVINRHQRDI